jgi:SAM-dependent methyltransferases related to tRNA (uracil-5-)-methyltransferase
MFYIQRSDLLKQKKVDVVIDAYSGAGILTAMISDNDYDTIGVEIVQSATIDADMVMRLNNCPRQRNINGDVKTILPDIFKEYKGKESD